MAFIREFNATQIQKMTNGANAELFAKLKADVFRGKVFPAVRKNELHFYYKGGCLYKFSGGLFKRDNNYERYGGDTEGLSDYETFKNQVRHRYADSNGKAMERQLLDGLYSYTYGAQCKSNVVVLDIEINLNGAVGGGKKCDMVLLNTQTDEIMFVEGKVFSDSRVLVAIPFIPEVVAQVSTYTAAIVEQRQVIIEQYANHIQIVNRLFGTSYRPSKKLIEPAKLLTYNTPKCPTENGTYSIDKINRGLGSNNVLWVEQNYNPTLDVIWRSLAL
ncbi:MAG: hypothetical protein K2M47_00250 [Clostridiales bacterium]|nr:hypothetical protein [Clostridiales bacterium]